MKQILNEIKTLIRTINENIDKLNPDLLNTEHTKISLIVNNLSSSIESAEKKFLLTANLENIKDYLEKIAYNIMHERWDINDSYLYEIIKDIAYLNNCNGKQSLQGYSKSVTKNIDLLETKINALVEQLENITSTSNKNCENLDVEVQNIKTKMDQDFVEYEKSFLNLKNKQEKELDDLKKIIYEFKESLLNDKNNIVASTNEHIRGLESKVNEETLTLTQEIDNYLNKIQKVEEEKLNELKNNIDSFIKNKQARIDSLVKLAEKQVSMVSNATYSYTYKEYADKFKKSSNLWYLATLLSLCGIVGISLYWFVFNNFGEANYLSLIAKVLATIAIIGLAKYSSVQASKNKKLEIKLRKTQLQMATFDTFVANLPEKERNRLKIQLIELLINEKDWLPDEKNEINITEDMVKLLERKGIKFEINKSETFKNGEEEK